MSQTEGTQPTIQFYHGGDRIPMFALSLLSLAIASVATFLSLNIEDEVFKAATACAAILAFILTLLISPWPLKLTIVAIPWGIGRFRTGPAQRSPN